MNLFLMWQDRAFSAHITDVVFLRACAWTNASYCRLTVICNLD